MPGPNLRCARAPCRRRPARSGVKLQGTPDGALQGGSYDVRGIKTNRTGFLTPAFAVEPLTCDAAVKQSPDREDIGPFVGLLATINFRRSIAVIEYWLTLQFIIVADIVKTRQFNPMISTISHGVRADVVHPQAPAMDEANCLTNLNREVQGLAFLHSQPAATP